MNTKVKETDVISPLILGESYADNVRRMDETLAIDDSFDLLKKTVRVGQDELTLYYIDGFVKDGTMTKVIMHLMGSCDQLTFSSVMTQYHTIYC